MTEPDRRRQNTDLRLQRRGLGLWSQHGVGFVHDCFDGSAEVFQIVLVRHVGRFDRLQDDNPCAARKEETRTRARHAFRAFDDNGQDRETRVDSDAERTLHEGKQLTPGAAGSFREHDERKAPLSSYLYTFDDGLARRSTGCTIDLDDPNRSHGTPDHGDLEDLLLGKESAVNRQCPEQGWNIEQREMIRYDHVSLGGVHVVEAINRAANRRDLQEQPRPSFDDPVMDRGGRSKYTVDHDDRRLDDRVDEEQRYEDHGAESCKNRADHGR